VFVGEGDEYVVIVVDDGLCVGVVEYVYVLVVKDVFDYFGGVLVFFW